MKSFDEMAGLTKDQLRSSKRKRQEVASLMRQMTSQIKWFDRDGYDEDPMHYKWLRDIAATMVETCDKTIEAMGGLPKKPQKPWSPRSYKSKWS